MSKPFFSVVIPTRDRAHLVPFAIRSVLEQTFRDFEIIVSDNFSSDNTSDVARSFGDDRIKYFRSEHALSLGESWEFALSHATGEYVTFLSDDDAYAKIFLERLFAVIEAESADVVSCKQIAYFTAPTENHGRPIDAHSLQLDRFDRQLTVLDNAEAVRHLLGRVRLGAPRASDLSVGIPQLVNSACKHSLVKFIQKRVKNIFPAVGSDMYSATLFLNFTNKYCYLDEPLYLHAEWDGSATVDATSFFERFPSERDLKYVPLKQLLSFSNLSTNYVLWGISDLGSGFMGAPIEWAYYFISAFKEICYMQANGRNTADLQREFHEALDRQSDQERQTVRAAISKWMFLKARATAALKRSPLGAMALHIRYRNIRYLSGFDDIFECARQIDESFLDRYAE